MFEMRLILPVIFFTECVWSYKHADLLEATFFSNQVPKGNRQQHGWSSVAGNEVNAEILGFLKYSPKPKDLKLKRLIKRLGESFNDKWMSIERPRNVDQNDVTLSGNDEIENKLLADFEALNMTLTDKNNIVANVSDKTLDLFKRWLIQHGTCTIRFEWTDIGGLFWPRWIRKGICETDVSCSWPPGMKCVATDREVLHILRWNCRNKKRKGRKRRRHRLRNDMRSNRRRRGDKYGGMKCRWLKIPYTVNNRCICSC